MKRNQKLLGLCLLCFTLGLWGNSGWILAKAHLAQYLIADAWRASLHDGQTHPPWRWADTWPVAKLVAPAHNLRLYVLAGGHGSALAFGPGHMDGSAEPGQNGTVVIAGHRDTHFRFLQRAQIGEVLLLQDSSGGWRNYQITEARVVDSRREDWRIDPGANQLQLLTCYPFDAVNPGGPLRYLVVARQVGS